MYSITLPIPDHIYNKAKHIAETTHQPIENVLLNHIEEAFLPRLPETEQRELDALAHLSDDALWTIAREQMTDDKQNRMQALMQNNSTGLLNSGEQQELENLVEHGQRLMLRKAQAATLLAERGHKVVPEDLASSNVSE